MSVMERETAERRRRRSFAGEFKRDAVAMVRDCQSLCAWCHVVIARLLRLGRCQDRPEGRHRQACAGDQRNGARYCGAHWSSRSGPRPMTSCRGLRRETMVG
jgi:hypothetical protein